MFVIAHQPVREKPVEDAELEEWVRRGRAGDLDAFNALVGRFYGVTFRLAYRMLGHREAAEDATQEIFLRTWRSLPRFRGAARFSTWLHTIAVRHCLNAARQQLRHSPPIDLFGAPDECDTGGFPQMQRASPSHTEDPTLSIAVQDAIERLPEKLRVVVVLHFFAGYESGEMAAALGLHPNTIRHRFNQAMIRLKRTLGDTEEMR